MPVAESMAKEVPKAPKPEVKKELPAPAKNPNVLVAGGEYEQAVARLMELGFPKDHVESAMKAAFNNPDRAADYLINVLILNYHRVFLHNLAK